MSTWATSNPAAFRNAAGLLVAHVHMGDSFGGPYLVGWVAMFAEVCLMGSVEKAQALRPARCGTP